MCMTRDASESAPPPPFPRKRNAVFRLYDSPLYLDWAFWLTLGLGLLAGFSIATSPTPSAMPKWLDVSLAILFFVAVGGVLPTWIRLKVRRAVWKRRRQRSAAASGNESPASSQGSPQIVPRVEEVPINLQDKGRNFSVDARKPAGSLAGGELVASSETIKGARRELPYPVASAARSLQLATNPKDQYQATLDAAEALTITHGVLAAAVFRSRNQDAKELVNLRRAYTTRGVAQGHWNELTGKLSKLVTEDAEILPGATLSLGVKGDDQDIVSLLTALLRERNNAAHGGRPSNSNEAAIRVSELTPTLELALRKSRYLGQSPWVLTERSSYRPKQGNFEVSARYAMGDHPDFERYTFSSSIPLADNTLYALLPDGPLEFSPFLVSRYCETCRQEEVFYAARVMADGTSLTSFGRGHKIFDQDLSSELRALGGASSGNSDWG